MTRRAFIARGFPVVILGAMLLGFGCRTAHIRVASMDEVERVRITPAIKDLGTRGAEVFARAERERNLARAAHASGDDVAATLHAEWAIAAYGHALAVARLSAAIADLADAQGALDEATTQEQSLAASRAKLELEGADLERRARLARARLVPSPDGDVAGDREAADRSARSLGVDARLLCGAALLVASDAAALADAEGELSKLEGGFANGSPQSPRGRGGREARPGAAEVDEAGAARSRCLNVLIRARRSAGDVGAGADALLSELSASGGWDPTRDERGVVVTMRGAFVGTQLTADGEAKLVSLGRVASSHPRFALQIVLHDAQNPSAKDDGDAARTAAIVRALLAGGAPAARLKAELAGTAAPIVDPNDARLRARNERLDVVFVAGS
jgi:hypothetical protein